MKIRLTIALLFSICVSNTYSQDNDTIANYSFDIGADMVSRYVWRSLLFNSTANIQPWATFTYKNFSIGTWGSYAISGNYAEVDFYITYKAKWFKFTIFDYYTQDESGKISNDYFNFKKAETSHLVEGSIAYTISEKFPLTTTVATFLYGADYNAIDNRNYYSTYVELAYPFTVSNILVNTFCGTTLNEGFYAKKAGVINVGVKAQKDITISDKYSLPISTLLSLNPTSREIFFVFGIHF